MLERPIADDSATRFSAWPVVAARFARSALKAECQTAVTHSHAVLTFYTAGSSRMQQNGEWNAQTGDAVLVPAGAPHRLLELKQAEFWGLGLCVPCVASDSVASLLEPFERVRDGGAAVVHIPEHRHQYLE